MTEKGHWYTDKNGNHYFVKEGETPKEGWERSKRRKMIDGGKYKVDDGDGKGARDVEKDEYDKYEADPADFDENVDDDFGFDEEEENEADKEMFYNIRTRYMSEGGDFEDMKKEFPGADDNLIRAAMNTDINNFDDYLDYRDKKGGWSEEEENEADRMKEKFADRFTEEEMDAAAERVSRKHGMSKEKAKEMLFGGEEIEEESDFEDEDEKTRAELARKEVEAVAPKEPGLRGAWKDGLVVTDKNKESFLNENGFAKDFYWDGNDLIDKKADKTVYSLPRAGAKADLIQGRMGFGSDEKDKRRPKFEAEDKDVDDRKMDHIKEYFDIWGKPGQKEFDDVVKFYGLNETEAAELKKHFGYGESGDEKTYKPEKEYSIYGEELKGNALKRMQDLKSELDKLGLSADVKNVWQDYGAGIRTTNLISDGAQVLTPREWSDYMNGKYTPSEMAEKITKKDFWSKRIKGGKNPNDSSQSLPRSDISKGAADGMANRSGVKVSKNDDGTLTISGNDGDIDQFMEMYNKWLKGKK